MTATLAALVVVLSAAFGTGAPQTEKDRLDAPLSVRGVELGDSAREVLRRLGRPAEVSTEKVDGSGVFGADWRRTFVYDGLLIETSAATKAGPYEVIDIEVTSPRWELSNGVRVGMSYDDVASALGGRGLVSPGDADEPPSITTVNSDGYGFATFEFANGKLVRASWGYDLS